MHNYIVPNKYKFDTRIGNWSEEQDLEDYKMKDYLLQKNGGQLNSTVKDQKQTFSMRPASISLPSDEYLHYNYHVMLRNSKTSGFLACDIQEKIKCNEEAYAVTTTEFCPYPCVRSVFVITKWEKEQNKFNDDILHYGQKFRIIANPRISNNKTFWLHSLQPTPSRCAKMSRKQEVCVINSDVFNTVWCIEHADPKIRFEMDGQPIRFNDPVLIKHCFTQQWLASDEIIYQNDWGKEREVFCHSFSCLNKTQNLIAEKQGRTTIEIPLRNQEPQNIWRFSLATDVSQNFEEGSLDETTGVSTLISRIKKQILQKGVYGVRRLAKFFSELDVNQSYGVLEYEDLKWGLKNYGIQTSEDETKLLFAEFDRNKNGSIDYNEFLLAFRQQPNENRSKLIETIYKEIQKKSNGKVTLDTLGKLIIAKRHPEVIKGYKTERQVFADFVNNWDKATPEKEISFEEFQQYYIDISSSVEKDEFFEALIRNVWGL